MRNDVIIITEKGKVKFQSEIDRLIAELMRELEAIHNTPPGQEKSDK